MKYKKTTENEIVRKIEKMEKEVLKRAETEENARRNELKAMSKKALLIELNLELAVVSVLLNEKYDELRLELEEIKSEIASI